MLNVYDLKEEYEEIYPYSKSIAEKLQKDISSLLDDFDRIDRIAARSKSVDRFIGKATKKIEDQYKYSDPINQIQDIIGARIITFYLDDVSAIETKILEEYTKIESKTIEADSYKEFSYIGKHLILFIPEDLKNPKFSNPKYFELQIKTLFQHAWAEAEHDLNYKSEVELCREDKRLLAFSAAQAWGADKVFNDVFNKCK